MSAYTIILIMAGYFGLLLLISHFTSRSSDNNAFFRGERKSPWWLVAFGMIGTSISGVSVVSVPGMVRDMSMTYLQMCLGFVPGYILVAYVLLPVYYKLRLTSIYDYLESRFGHTSHKTGAWFFLISKLCGAAARLIYTRRSGVKTLVWTDALQTLALITAVVTMLIVVSHTMGLNFSGIVSYVHQSPYGRIFVFDNWRSGQYFCKEFISGIFIVIVMTGLDQDMMQKNLSCKNLRDAQKDMTAYGLAFLPMNMLFLALGVLLYGYCAQRGIATPEHTDELLPMLASGGYLGAIVPVMFVIGIIAAAFSSADSALTALTTSFCIDILGLERGSVSREKAAGTRRRVHLMVTLAFILFILAFKALNSTSVIDAVYIMASYTYGPLLGMFAFGMFTRRQPRDKYVPIVAIISPVICYLASLAATTFTSYRFGYELLLLNGLLTFLGLLLLSCRRSRA